MSWVLYRVLAEHHRWRYCLRADRWRLASSALRLVRLALLAAPTPPPAGSAAAAAASAAGASEGEDSSTIAAAVVAVLQYDVGMASCLLTALPYHADLLEVRCVLRGALRGLFIILW